MESETTATNHNNGQITRYKFIMKFPAGSNVTTQPTAAHVSVFLKKTPTETNETSQVHYQNLFSEPLLKINPAQFWNSIELPT